MWYVVWSVCLSVCACWLHLAYVTVMICAKTGEPIEMPFMGCMCGLVWAPNERRSRVPSEMGGFEGREDMWRRRDHSVVNIGSHCLPMWRCSNRQCYCWLTSWVWCDRRGWRCSASTRGRRTSGATRTARRCTSGHATSSRRTGSSRASRSSGTRRACRPTRICRRAGRRRRPLPLKPAKRRSRKRRRTS